MTLEQVLQAVRTWLKTAAGGTALTDTQVFSANPGTQAKGGTRPPMPYLLVNILDETERGSEAGVSTVGGDVARPTWKVKGQMRATATVNAFGDGAVEWLRTARLRLPDPVVQDGLTTLGISVRSLGPMRNLSALRDSSFESRYLAEFEIGYTWTSTAVEVLPALIGEVVTTLTAPDGTVRAAETTRYPVT